MSLGKRLQCERVHCILPCKGEYQGDPLSIPDLISLVVFDVVILFALPPSGLGICYTGCKAANVIAVRLTAVLETPILQVEDIQTFLPFQFPF